MTTRSQTAGLLLALLSACGAGGAVTPSATPSPGGAGALDVEPIKDAAGAVDRLAGAAVQASLLRTDDAYAAAVARHFSYLTAEFEMKWGHIERERGTRVFGPADEIVAFAQARGIRVKGHALVWHGDSPAWLESLTPAELRAALRDHIHDEVGRYRGRVVAWDVVNEAIAENGGGLRDTVFLRKLGPGYLADAFRWAREADPDVLLVYNDYGGEGLNRKSDDVYELVSGLVREGAPIGGVGLQMHLDAAALPPAADVARNLRRLAELGLVVNVSEMDVRIARLGGDAASKLEAQRRVYHDIAATCVAEPRCHAVTFWGFTDAHSWIDSFFAPDDPLLFDESLRAKPAYYGVMDALRGR
jgi:endo-1,4-beta-xylanase